MRDDDLDHILSEWEDIVPSSGFATSVMGAVRRDATIPPPIPFPWRYAVPGLAVAGLALMWVLVGLVDFVARKAIVMQVPSLQPSMLAQIMQTVINARNGWIGLVLFMTVASLSFSLRLSPGGR
jgi:hypothetical protein